MEGRAVVTRPNASPKDSFWRGQPGGRIVLAQDDAQNVPPERKTSI